jgi:hypothetical protein
MSGRQAQIRVHNHLRAIGPEPTEAMKEDPFYLFRVGYPELAGIDFATEGALILAKRSRLSAKAREIVLAALDRNLARSWSAWDEPKPEQPTTRDYCKDRLQ